jgi:hypothetical protein
MRKRDRDAGAAVETPHDSKRRRTVAFHATVERVVGRADPEVDRTPFGEPPRCGGCGLHCLGRRYGCVRCHADAFCLCVVCFSAHVRMSAPEEPDASPENHQRRDHATSPSSSSPSARPSFPDGDIRNDVAHILRAAREQAAAARAAQEEDEDEEGDDEMEETYDDDDGDAFAFAMDDGTAPDASSAGVHVHPPEEFRREGDGDQEAMDEMMREKRAFAEKRERDAAEAAERANADANADAHESADVELTASNDGTSHVIVVDVGGSADAADASKPGLSRGGISTWDYASEII